MKTTTPTPSIGRFAAGLLGLLAAGSLIACSNGGDGAEAAAPARATTTTVGSTIGKAVPGDADTSPTDDQVDGQEDGGDAGSDETTSPGSGGDSSGGGSSSDGPSTDETSGPAPRIDSFETPENIDCHNGDFQEFTASWTTTGATEVTISIDGPGAYGTYPADGSADLPFSCSTPHTFLLTAYGAGGETATRTVTLEPRNVQMPDPAEDDTEMP